MYYVMKNEKTKKVHVFFALLLSKKWKERGYVEHVAYKTKFTALRAVARLKKGGFSLPTPGSYQLGCKMAMARIQAERKAHD